MRVVTWRVNTIWETYKIRLIKLADWFSHFLWFVLYGIGHTFGCKLNINSLDHKICIKAFPGKKILRDICSQLCCTKTIHIHKYPTALLLCTVTVNRARLRRTGKFVKGGKRERCDETLIVQLSPSKLYALIHFCSNGEQLQSFPAKQIQMAWNGSKSPALASPAEELAAFYGLALESTQDNTLQ